MTKLVPILQWRIADGVALDARLLQLLTAIEAGANLAAAVAEVGLSYRHGWGLLHAQAALLGVPLVDMQRGKGVSLTQAGQQLLRRTAGAEQRLLRRASAIEIAPVSQAASEPLRLSLHASHDLALIELRERIAPAFGLELDLEFKGSLEALSSFAAGHADLAGFHIPLGSHPGALAPFQRWLKPRQHRLIGFIEREQGLMLPPGNPAHVRGLGDLAGNKLRVVNRQRGSGTRLLFDQLLQESGIDGHALRGYSTEEFTHLAVAATIAAGKADAGFGVKAAALQYGLAFKLLERERYLLACRSEAAKEPTIRRLREAIASPAMLRVIRSLPGYADANSGSLLSFTRGFAGSSKAKRN
ncbi:MAG: substrate-binding domain-containing protein [Pseudomonadota bacterium]